MERSRLRSVGPTVASSSRPSERKEQDSVSALYGSVKLKKTGTVGDENTAVKAKTSSSTGGSSGKVFGLGAIRSRFHPQPDSK